MSDQYVTFIKEGYPMTVKASIIESVTELKPGMPLPFPLPNTHGCLLIQLDNYHRAQIALMSGKEINDFYAAWCPIALPGKEVLKSPLGTP